MKGVYIVLLLLKRKKELTYTPTKRMQLPFTCQNFQVIWRKFERETIFFWFVTKNAHVHCTCLLHITLPAFLRRYPSHPIVLYG